MNLFKLSNLFTLVALVFSLQGWAADEASFKSGPLRAEDCDYLLGEESTNSTYQCSACGETNALNALGITTCWQCGTGHTNEKPGGRFEIEKSSGQYYVRLVDVIPYEAKIVTSRSRIQCPECGYSNPGVDPKTEMAPERCANPGCKDASDLDKLGHPQPARLDRDGHYNRLVYQDGMNHLVLVPDRVAYELDRLRWIENNARVLHARLRQEFVRKFGNRQSVEQMDDQLLQKMVSNMANSVGMKDVDIDQAISDFKILMKRQPSQVTSQDALVSAGQNMSSSFGQFVSKHKKAVIGAALATIGLTGISWSVYGYEPTFHEAQVTYVDQQSVILSVQIKKDKFDDMTFRVPNDFGYKIEVGDMVSVHGRNWFDFYGVSGLGFESGGYYDPSEVRQQNNDDY